MKTPILISTFCFLLFALTSCKDGSSSNSIAVGPFEVDSETGMGRGQAFGIDFEVAGATRSQVKFDLHGTPGTSSKAEIIFADDRKIELETSDGGESVMFKYNGEEVGSLKKGDQVEISEEGVVTTNSSE